MTQRDDKDRTQRETTNNGTFVLQSFLNFSKYASAKQESLTRRASMSRNSFIMSTSGATQDSDVNVTVTGLATPAYPLILRIPDSSTAEQTTIQALHQFYLSKWEERVQEVAQQLESLYGVKPSESLSLELAVVGRSRTSSASAKPTPAKDATIVPGTLKRRLSSVDMKRERAHDDIIKTVLQIEERYFYESVLPSRFLDDYQICISLADGTLPNPSKGGAVTTSKPHQVQLIDGAEKPSNWIVPPGVVVKQHPKASFPYSVAIFYKPTKTSRTMNDILSRSASFVSSPTGRNGFGAFPTTSDANVTHLLGDRSAILHNSADPLKSATQYLVAQTAPKNMLSDDVARKRGFTILPFLPALRAQEPPIDPYIAKLLFKTVDSSRRQTVAGRDDVNSGADEEEVLDPIDITVEELMEQAGLTMYDVARHGNGQLAQLGKEHVLEQVPLMAKGDVERRRQENIIRAERAAAAREQNAIRLAEKKELSLREVQMAEAAVERLKNSRDHMDSARDQLVHEHGKEERRIAIQRRVDEYKQAAEAELQEQRQRQTNVLAELEVTLREKAVRRRQDTTLEGERTKAEELSRRAGPLSLRLNEFRPKVKQLDQEQRQSLMYTQLVSKLDTSLALSSAEYHTNTEVSLGERTAYHRKVGDEVVVRTADHDSLVAKGATRNNCITDLERQRALVDRPAADVSVLRIATKASTPYFCPTAEEEVLRQAQREKNFLDWKERRRVEVEATIARQELGIKQPQM